MDETLIDWSKTEGEWSEHRKRHLAPVHTYLQENGYTTPGLEDFSQAYNEHVALVWQKSTPPDWACPTHYDVMRSVLESMEVSTNGLDFTHLAKLFAWDAIPGVRPFDDTIGVLTVIRGAGLKTGLVTNAIFPMWMRDVELKTLGLFDYLDERLTAGDVGRLKPHPVPFEEMLRRLGIGPDEAVFVGDQLEDDIQGAQRVGMRAVWVRRSSAGQLNGRIKPNAIINKLGELPGLLDIWFTGWR